MCIASSCVQLWNVFQITAIEMYTRVHAATKLNGDHSADLFNTHSVQLVPKKSM